MEEIEMVASTTDVMHPGCFACSPGHPFGLRLSFDLANDSSVVTELSLSSDYEGYPGCVHGGIIATLLDAAMTHCLLEKGIPAYTAKLDIRYKRPLMLDQSFIVIGELLEDREPLYDLNARIQQNDALIASAKARFMKPGIPTL